jgi:hypothetical protein
LALKYNKPKTQNHGQNHLDSILSLKQHFLVADLSKNMALPAYSPIPFGVVHRQGSEDLFCCLCFEILYRKKQDSAILKFQK